uniref:THAP-type domain-containing protein n=1 Tax=Latimeria chalumnae TaxID=7897 RepID=H3AMW6_LATCH
MPSTRCAVIGCCNSRKKLRKWKTGHCPIHQCNLGTSRCDCPPPFRLFTFPTLRKNKEARQKWIELINRQDPANKNKRVCSVHFPDREPSMENPYPVLDLGYSDTKPSVSKMRRRSLANNYPTTVKPGKRAAYRKLRFEEPSPTDIESEKTTWEEEQNEERTQNEETASLDPPPVGIQTRDAKGQKGAMMKCLRTSRKVKFYTGLPDRDGKRSLAPALVKKQLARKNRLPKSLSKREQLLLVLMRLRLGLQNEDLADRFEVPAGFAARVFYAWVRLLSQHLQGLVAFPSRELIMQTLPECFLPEYKRLRCIVDCAEVPIEAPRDARLQAVTWSDYKRCHAVKYLIGLTPLGFICFVSKGWGARVLDRQLIVNSGFLDSLEPSDVVMAERGFPIQKELLMKGATLVIPPGVQGQEEMMGVDALQAKKIAHLRTNVERAVDRIRWFRLIREALPLTLLPLVDDIVVVCAALCNLLPPLANSE